MPQMTFEFKPLFLILVISVSFWLPPSNSLPPALGRSLRALTWSHALFWGGSRGENLSRNQGFNRCQKKFSHGIMASSSCSLLRKCSTEHWLLAKQPLWKMMEFVSRNHQPVGILPLTIHLSRAIKHVPNHQPEHIFFPPLQWSHGIFLECNPAITTRLWCGALLNLTKGSKHLGQLETPTNQMRKWQRSGN